MAADGKSHDPLAETVLLSPDAGVTGFSAGDWVDDRYQILDAAGGGGFSTVYRALDTRLQQDVALKVLHPHLASLPRFAKRFEREAELLSSISHPRVAAVLGRGVAASHQPYLAISWIEGQPLDQALAQRGVFSAAEALAVFSDLAEAVSAIHAVGVVHRDLKPSNVMLVRAREGEREHAVLLDFGIAKFLDDDEQSVRLTQTNECVGTPYYMAPEQILRNDIDARADIYSMGVMLYEIVTGKRPFSAPTAVELQDMHLRVPPPSAIASGAPRSIDAIIQRCLGKDPSERFANADALRAALEVARREIVSGSAAPDGAGTEKQTALAIAILVEMRAAPGAGERDSEAIFDSLDDLSALAEEKCEQLGLTLALQTASSLLMLRNMGAGETVESERERIERGARALADELADGCDPTQISVAVKYRTGTVVIDTGTDGDEISGGELLDPSFWEQVPQVGSLPGAD